MVNAVAVGHVRSCSLRPTWSSVDKSLLTLCHSNLSGDPRIANRNGARLAWGRTLARLILSPLRHVPRLHRVKERGNQGVSLSSRTDDSLIFFFSDPDASPLRSPVESDFDRSADPIDFISSQEKSPPKNRPHPATSSKVTPRVAQPPPFALKSNLDSMDKPKPAAKVATLPKQGRGRKYIADSGSEDSSSSRPVTRSKTSSVTFFQPPSSQPPSSQETDPPTNPGADVQSAPRLRLIYHVQSSNQLPLRFQLPNRPPLRLPLPLALEW